MASNEKCPVSNEIRSKNFLINKQQEFFNFVIQNVLFSTKQTVCHVSSNILHVYTDSCKIEGWFLPAAEYEYKHMKNEHTCSSCVVFVRIDTA